MKVIVSESRIGVEYKTQHCNPIRGNFAESSSGCKYDARSLKEKVAAWYRKAYPSDKDMIDEMRFSRSTFQDVLDALDYGKDVYEVIGADDSIVRERVFEELSKLTGKDYDYFYDKWLSSDDEEYSGGISKMDGSIYGEDGYLAEYDESSDAGEFEVEIEFIEDKIDAGVKKGDKFKFPIDIEDAQTECVNPDGLVWYVNEAFKDYARANGIGDGSTIWIHPSSYDIVNHEELNDAVLGDMPEYDFETMEPEDIPDSMSFKDGLVFYGKMREAYDDNKLKYSKFDQFKQRLMDVIVKGLLKDSTIEELGEEWFKNYGTMNGWGWKTSFKYGIASKLHEIHMKKHPDEHHKVPQKNHWSGWREDNCSCGFCSSSDSSD